ncbi:hypothetical protein [Pseudarthrobacter phenanthrenivorans]|uniref:hypothetical protein n=1 Tax=Pseudarthrobacter phenanthrenivorans TaxID=361575 RepID=UPI003F80C43B
MRVGQIGAVALNEAFAAQPLACIRRLGFDPETVKNDGGAIAFPLGVDIPLAGALLQTVQWERHFLRRSSAVSRLFWPLANEPG